MTVFSVLLTLDTSLSLSELFPSSLSYSQLHKMHAQYRYTNTRTSPSISQFFSLVYVSAVHSSQAYHSLYFSLSLSLSL